MPVRQTRSPHAQPKHDITSEWRAHALRVALGLRSKDGKPTDEQLELVRTWVDQALAIKTGVQKATRAEKSRLRVRSSRGKAGELADETGSALWHAAHAEVLPDGLTPWPLANAQHLVISAGMFDVAAGTRSFGALHVGVLALVALGHKQAAIARALGRRDSQVRKTLRMAGEISLSDLYAQ